MKTTNLSAFMLLALTCCSFADYGRELASYAFGTTDIVRDPTRDRVYCAVPSQNGVAVLDSTSLGVVANIFTGSNPSGLDVSTDGKFLYVANAGSLVQGITVINLEDLTIVRQIQTVSNSSDVAVGGGRVYSLETGDGKLRAYDAGTGALLTGSLHTFSGGVFISGGGGIEITSDGSTLYFYNFGLSPSSWYKINVASWPGQVAMSGRYGENGQDIALSNDDQYISFASGSPYHVEKLSAADPRVSHGQMNIGPYPRAVAFSTDGNYLFAVHTTGHIDVWNTNTYVSHAQITTPGEPRDLETDRTGRVLFAGTSTSLKAYYVSVAPPPQNVPNLEIYHAVELRWESVYGRLYQPQWSHVMGANATWYNLGAPILGNGLTLRVFDSAKDSRKKFYRVNVLSQ